MEIKELVDQLNTANTELKNMRNQHAEEIKSLGDAQAETKTKLEEAEQKFNDLLAKFENVDTALKDIQAQKKRPGYGMDGEVKTLGSEFVASDVYAEIKSTGRGNSKPLEVKEITSLSTSAGALQDSYRDPEVYRTIGGMRQLRIRDLIPTVPVSSGSVEIMRMASFDNQAGPQGTVAGIGGGEFVAKNQSDMTWELVTVPVRTIAHWVPASRQALSDAPMLQGLIDTELTYGLQLESDDQILNGDGTGQNLSGILNDSAINDVGELASGTAAADVPAAMIDHIRAAITECQKSEYYNINGVVLNPVDFATLETAKATDGHYILMPFAATAGQAQEIWRVPVIVSNAMPVSTFLLGDWRIGAKIYAREGVSVRVSESHADYFVKNGVAVLGEERYALAVSRPKAFTKGAFTVAV
jgi:HK97 family phage major capsid protein